MTNSIFGYFTHAESNTPEYDPGTGVQCPFCLKPLAAPFKTISLMPMEGAERSFFYRAHKACYESASEADIGNIEGSVIS